MSYYVDPNFDTYSLDACARYGILTSDPCMYLTGKPSPYLSQYQTSQLMQPLQPDSFYASYNQDVLRGKPPWKKIALGIIGTAFAIALAVKCPKLFKKIIPSNIKTTISNNTPRFIKNAYSGTTKFLSNSWTAFKKQWQKLCK